VTRPRDCGSLGSVVALFLHLVKQVHDVHFLPAIKHWQPGLFLPPTEEQVEWRVQSQQVGGDGRDRRVGGPLLLLLRSPLRFAAAPSVASARWTSVPGPREFLRVSHSREARDCTSDDRPWRPEPSVIVEANTALNSSESSLDSFIFSCAHRAIPDGRNLPLWTWESKKAVCVCVCVCVCKDRVLEGIRGLASGGNGVRGIGLAGQKAWLRVGCHRRWQRRSAATMEK
jgi:hypothetical protein